MKTTLTVKRTLSLLLGLLLLLACGTAAAEDALESAGEAAAPIWLPFNINWDLNTDAFAQATKEYSEALYLLRETDEIQEYWLEPLPEGVELPDLAWLDAMEVPVAPEDPVIEAVGAYYIFRYDVLACTGIEYGPSDPAVFTGLQAGLTAVYGDPVETYPGQALYMFNAYKVDFPEELLGDVSGWWMADDTQVLLMSVADAPYVFYVNKDHLYGNPPE